MTERLGSDQSGDTPPERPHQEGADSDEPRLHIKETVMEERLQWLRSQRDAGVIEGSTQELRAVASLSPDEELTDQQKKAAERLEERETEERKQEKALEFVRKLNVTRVPSSRRGGRRSTDR